MAVVQLRTNEKVDYSVIVKDATGADARVASPLWTVTGPVKILVSNPPEGGLPGEPPGTWGGSGEPFPTPPIANVPGAPGSPPGEVRPPEFPQPPIENPPGGPVIPPTPPGSNLPPVATHPDVGIPHPQPIDEAEVARQKAKADAPKPRMTGPYTCTIAALGGETGPATVSFTCDADLGDGVKPLIAIGAIAVVAGEAAVVELEPGAPVPQEPPAEPALATADKSSKS